MLRAFFIRRKYLTMREKKVETSANSAKLCGLNFKRHYKDT